MLANRNARAQQVVNVATFVGGFITKAYAQLHDSLRQLDALLGLRRDGWLSMRGHCMEPALTPSPGPSEPTPIRRTEWTSLSSARSARVRRFA
jgi:hypothetical protein